GRAARLRCARSARALCALRRDRERRRPERERPGGARHRGRGRGAPQARPAARGSHGARRAMLTPLSASGAPAPAPTPRRPRRSLKQEYHEFILQRIEEYKNTLTREELLEIGDEAVRELEENAAGQYLLTEVLLLEHVDRI